MTTKNILYIHGFNSSPLSTKAEQSRKYFAQNFPDVNFHCPQLPSSPKAAISMLEDIVEKSLAVNHEQTWLLMGSSLGGYFSTYLSEKYQLKAVLINPAIKPYELLAEYIGEQKNPYTNECYRVEKSHMTDLKQLSCEIIEKKSYLVMVQMGDEVLDYRQAVRKYKNCQLIVQSGGDHSFVDYQQMLPTIAKFLALS